MKSLVFGLGVAVLLAIPSLARAAPKGVAGDYMEFRGAVVYAGPCFANGEMNLGGKNALLAWHVRRANGTACDWPA